MYTSDSYPSQSDRHHIALLLDVARRYYVAGESQADIASAISFSRPTVSRLLTEARQRGIVQLKISHPLERLASLEAQLTEAFGLKSARVADASSDVNTASEVVRCAASLLVESCNEDSLITVSNGSAVAATVSAVPQMHWPRSRVVQMIGSLGQENPMTDSPEVCRRLAWQLGGAFHALSVPLVLSSSAIAASMRQEAQIAATLALGGRAEVALVGVGTVQVGRSGHIFDAYETPETVAALVKAGAVAHICGHHISRDGEHIATPICKRTISIDPERMRQIPLVIGVAWGSQKVQALRAVMRGGFISALVTDKQTAEQLLMSPPVKTPQ